jgi:hypothetical protein
MATYAGARAAAAIADLIARDGASDGLVAVKVVEFHTPEGQRAWGVVWRTDPDHGAYEHPNPYVVGPRVIWTQDKATA